MFMINASHRKQKDKWARIISAVGSLIREVSWDVNALFFNLNDSCLLLFFCFKGRKKGTSELLGTYNTYVPLASSDHKGYKLHQLRQETL